MRIVITAVGVTNRRPLAWPEGWPIPREGDDVEIPDMPEISSVRHISWYPEGDTEGPEPFVYIVVGPKRPQ